MGKDTVFANGKSVATLGTDHVAVNEQEWDELLVAPTKAQMPTMNVAYMPTLQNGSTTTFYADFPVWTVAGYLLESVEYPAEPSGSLGLKTGNPYRGPSVCVMGSPTVFVEGSAVVRHHDPTKQDGGNSSGKVLMKSDLDRLKKALDDERARRAAAAAAAKKKKGRGAARKKPKLDKKEIQKEDPLAEKKRRREERLALIKGVLDNRSAYPPHVVAAANQLRMDMDAVECARLAEHVYDPSKPVPTGFTVVRPPGLVSDPSSGFQAQVYYSQLDGTYVLAFRGTEDTKDWLANLGQGSGWRTAQYNQALALTAQMRQEFGDKLVLTGHSLGGGLASAGGLQTGAPTYTFNSAGVHSSTVSQGRRYGLNPGGKQRIEAYRFPGEVLTTIQESGARYLSPAILAGIPVIGPLLAWKAGPMPRAPGNKHDVPESLESTRRADMLEKHKFPHIKDEIEEQKKREEAAIKMGSAKR